MDALELMKVAVEYTNKLEQDARMYRPSIPREGLPAWDTVSDYAKMIQRVEAVRDLVRVLSNYLKAKS